MIDDLPDDIPFETTVGESREAREKAFSVINKRIDAIRESAKHLQESSEEQATDSRADIEIKKSNLLSDISSAKAQISVTQVTVNGLVSPASSAQSQSQSLENQYNSYDQNISNAESALSGVSANNSASLSNVSSANAAMSPLWGQVNSLQSATNAMRTQIFNQDNRILWLQTTYNANH